MMLGEVAEAQVADRPRGPVLSLGRLVRATLLVDDDAAGSEAEDVADALSHRRQQSLGAPADLESVAGLSLVGGLVGPDAGVAGRALE
jgi:hypothetical protein